MKISKYVSYDEATNRGVYRPKTGDEILPGPSGFPDVPMVSELEFWQNMPAVFFTGKNLESIAPMLKMVQRQRI